MELIKKDKIIIIVSILIVIGISIFILLNRNNIFKKEISLKEDKLIIEKINVDSKINEIIVIDSRIEKLGKVSNIFIKIKNNTNNEIDKSDLKLIIYDKDNNIVLISNIYNVDKFNIGEEREVQVATNNDISNAYKYIVEKEK